jgi:hypothetical protein
MISTTEEFNLTHEQLARVERALEAIRREVRPKNESLYRVMAEGYIEQIRELRAQIDKYLGLDECNSPAGRGEQAVGSASS